MKSEMKFEIKSEMKNEMRNAIELKNAEGRIKCQGFCLFNKPKSLNIHYLFVLLT